jgi:hypothetical protein
MRTLIDNSKYCARCGVYCPGDIVSLEICINPRETFDVCFCLDCGKEIGFSNWKTAFSDEEFVRDFFSRLIKMVYPL